METRVIDINSKEYPTKLKEIKDSPKKLYVRGNLPDENKKSVAIIGARACSDYGSTLAKLFAKELAKNDVQIIGGLSLGIQTSAHIGALEMEKATFGVLGCGPDICYPSYNYNVYERMLENGGMISEYKDMIEPSPINFINRNRIITGLSDVVIIIESKNNGAAIITSEYAKEQGKKIFACPNKVGESLGFGTNKLIKDGTAEILLNVNDVLNYLGIEDSNNNTIINIDNLDYFERLVYDSIDSSSIHFDEISVNTKLPYEKLHNVLISLQLSGYIENTAFNYYKKVV